MAMKRAKFFDYILPLMPINSFQNSKEYFKREINKYPSLRNSDIDDPFLYRLGIYIYDPREIVNLISELDIYTCKLNAISQKKLLAMIIYKNLFPQDFEGISIKKSNIAYFIEHKDDIGNITLKNAKIGTIFKYITKNNERLNFIKNSNKQLYQAISYINNREILRFLVLNNLIDLTFYDYISPTPYKLGVEDTRFVQNVINQRSPLHNIQVNNPKEIINALMSAEADFQYAYSDKILTTLVNLKNDSYKEIHSILRMVKQNEDYKFVIEWIKSSMQKNNSFQFTTNITLLKNIWDSFFDDLNKELKIGLNKDSKKIGDFLIEILLFEFRYATHPRVFNWYRKNNIFLKQPIQKIIAQQIKSKKYRKSFIELVQMSKYTIKLESISDLAGTDRELYNVLKQNKWYKNYTDSYLLSRNKKI
ncbi:hypothetical protein FP435_01025 [Lactobacillus sp. PV037]|nr:hypothetical protein [Lactobacillus sp. PV037]QNQ83120.1 hypothetical protein FP435_01025 [Lactobacillus sp. PV037]